MTAGGRASSGRRTPDQEEEPAVVVLTDGPAAGTRASAAGRLGLAMSRLVCVPPVPSATIALVEACAVELVGAAGARVRLVGTDAGWSPTPGAGERTVVRLTTGAFDVGLLEVHWSPDAPRPGTAELELLTAFAPGATLALLRARAGEGEERAEVALHDAEVRRAEVTAAIAHELRTPLTTIRGFIETLLIRSDVLGADDRRHMLEISLRNTVELTHRISALLEHAKLEADHIVIEPRPQRLAPAIEAAVDACSGLLSAHVLALDVPADLVVEVDEVALDHVVGNLLSNAAKFAPDGSVIRICAAVAEDRSAAVVSVEDRGGGIPAEHLPHVFDRFYRGEGADRRRRGSGIGLAIVKRYIELGGGRVWIESTEGQGTTVRFTVPLATIDPDGPADPEEDAGAAQLLALQASSQASSPRCQASIR